MERWHTLSGYLMERPGGALARLKGRRRRWYVFDECGCCLRSYKTESDASAAKQPTSTIDLHDAAISFLPEEENCFVIHSGSKEYVFMTDNHESMMVWVMALQASRDSCQERTPLKPVNLPLEERTRVTRKISLPIKLRLEDKVNIKEEDNQMWKAEGSQAGIKRKLSLQQLKLKSRSWKLTSLSTINHSSAMEEEQLMNPSCTAPVPALRSPGSPTPVSTSSLEGPSTVRSSTPRGLPPQKENVTRASRIGRGNSSNNSGRHHHRRALSQRGNHYSSTGVTTDGESDSDSFCHDGTLQNCGGFSSAMRERIRYLRNMTSFDSSQDCMTQERTGSVSGNSVSSDSAISHGDSALSLRLHELEAELMATKCELAKALNRETVQKNALIDQEGLVTELHQQIQCLEASSEDSKNSPMKGCSVQKLNDKCCRLQSHNRFLNEEVRKLSGKLQQQQSYSITYQNCLHDQEREIDQLKRDYVFLMQSAIRIQSMEGPEVMEVYLYGGEQHAARVLQLLKEARMSNPNLPVYDSQNKVLQHTDSLGFKQHYTKESLALHYICRQLHLHYKEQLPSSVHHLCLWRQYLFMSGDHFISTKELKTLVRHGIPAACRSQVWMALYRYRVADIIDDKGKNYYSNLCCRAPESEIVSQNKRQISLDLLRTLPNNVRFCNPEADGIRKLQEVLQAFCLHNPSLGYCQGMNFLVGMCLLFMEPEDAFWCLVAITERYFASNYFDHSLVGAQADQEVLKSMLQEMLPRLYRHLALLDIELCTVTLNWFLAIFFDSVPFETLLRIWDCFLLEGPKVLFRFSLAILKMHEDVLLTKQDTGSIMRQLKAAARLCYDVDTLLKVAFGDLQPFPRRNDIATKQACYQKALREQYKKREMEKQNLLARADSSDSYCEDALIIECAAACDETTIWVGHASPNLTRLSRVNCEDSVMYSLNIEVEARVICMHSLSDNTMLLGTLSHSVYSYSTRTRELKWEMLLNNSVLSLCSYQEDDQHQVFAGLADGTMAVIENFSDHLQKPDTLYIHVGSSPVTFVQLVDKRLWCATGNRIIILSARTLDTVDQFQVSSSSFDYISLIQPCSVGDIGDQAVWLSLRGSSVLQLWDAQTLTCKMLYDVREDRYPRTPKDEENELNQARITALLPLSGSVLVGTAEGFLIFYDLVPRSVHPDSKANSTGEVAETTTYGVPQSTVLESYGANIRARNDSGYLTATPLVATLTTSALTEYKSDDTCNETSGSQHSFTTVIQRSTELLSSSPKSGAGDDYPQDDLSDRSGEQNGQDKCFTKSEPLLSSSLRSDIPDLASTDPVDLSICPTTELCAKDVLQWSLKATDSCPSMEELPSRMQQLPSWCDVQYQILKRNYASTDCIPTWLSRDTLGSSVTSDSYDFDDFFVQYNDDGVPLYKEHDLMVIAERCFGNDNTQSVGEDVTVPSVLLTVDKTRGGSSGCSIWTENEEGGDTSTTTHDAAHNEWSEAVSYDVNHLSSDVGSNVSFNSIDPPYGYELVMQEKLKISDKAIRCLLELKCSGESMVISGAGCYGDDESVLKWTKERGEKLWTNDPVIEVCPYTNTIKPSPYTRSRLPRQVSAVRCSPQSRTFDMPVPNGVASGPVHQTEGKSYLEPPKHIKSMGARLARMQSIFAKTVEKE